MKSPEQIVVGLFVATDRQEWDKAAEYFDDEVLLDYSSMDGNPATNLTPEQIISAWKGILPGFEHTHHQIGNTMCSSDGNSAEVFCYGTASHYLNDSGGNLWVVVGTYDFELIKNENGSWKITSMKFNYKYQDGNTALPERAMNKLKAE